VPVRLLPFLLLACARAAAQTPSVPAEPWSWFAAANLYFPDEGESFVQPTAFVDRDRLHVEGRFNYEDRDTASAWAGYNLSAGESLRLEFTPMLGIVFGDTTGLAPGYKASIGWSNVELYSEAEYLFDADDSEESFLYTWTELTLAPSHSWRAGFVVQRTKTYETEFDIQRGVLAGFSRGRFEFTAYLLNPGASPTLVLAVGAGL
jgi:hypothetical protein